jgi:hypothetical protein
MRQIYDKNTANYPRLSTDVFFTDYNNRFKFDGFLDKTIKKAKQTKICFAFFRNYKSGQVF